MECDIFTSKGGYYARAEYRFGPSEFYIISKWNMPQLDIN